MPLLKESRGLDGLNLGKDYGECALASHLKAGDQYQYLGNCPPTLPLTQH